VIVETSEEKRLYELGEKNHNAKKALAQTALRKQTPNDQESDLIHAMWLRQLEYHGQSVPAFCKQMCFNPRSIQKHEALTADRVQPTDPNVATRKPGNVVFMDSTKMHSSQIMQPQFRNRHSFMIFGGFLLKQTFELAFCCAASFSHSRPTFLSLDPSTFDNTVPVGSVLYLTATVAYTDPLLVTASETSSKRPKGPQKARDDGAASANPQYTRVQIRIDSKVRNIEHGETKPTGQLNYTFLVEKDIKVMPRTYSEFMIWVDARRRAEKVRVSTTDLEEAHGEAQACDDGWKERVTE